MTVFLPVDDCKTTAGKVSILDDKSKSDVKSADVKIFSGAGMVSVWNNGLDEDGAMVGLNVLVKVLKRKFECFGETLAEFWK